MAMNYQIPPISEYLLRNIYITHPIRRLEPRRTRFMPGVAAAVHLTAAGLAWKVGHNE
jgi:hypothetical protein